jgi:hypothetical protein
MTCRRDLLTSDQGRGRFTPAVAEAELSFVASIFGNKHGLPTDSDLAVVIEPIATSTRESLRCARRWGFGTDGITKAGMAPIDCLSK